MWGKKRKANKLPPFVPLTWEMLNGRAYKSLPASAAKALPYFLGKVKVGFNSAQRYMDEFSFSYTEAKRFGFATATFSKVIRDLVRFGFCDPVDKGGLRGDCKSYNLFKLSQRWQVYGTPNFEALDWRCFIPKPRQRATSKREIDNSKKGNEKGGKGKTILDSEVIEDNFR